MTDPARLSLSQISKSYPGVRACDRISMRVAPGAIHAVLGENGAGKSTLMKIIYGLVAADAGTIAIDGAPITAHTPADARALGIGMAFQHFAVFESMTAAENVWLGLGRAFTLAQVRQRMQATATHYGLQLAPDRLVYSLSVGERQRLEIVRALMAAPRLLILDEPTSVLTPQDAQRLFVMLRQLADEGCSILYISHKLQEIRALCSHCTVLRAGQVVADFADPASHSGEQLARLMLGGELPTLPPRRAPTLALTDEDPAWNAPAVQLAVRHLDLPPVDTHGVALHRVSLALRGGEILGMAGVSGSGQAQLLAAISGEADHVPAGSIWLAGEDVSRLTPRQRRARGLRFIPEERLGRGAVPAMSLVANTLLTREEPLRRGGWINWRATRALTAQLITQFGVKAAGAMATAQSLSGGNLQKFIVARELHGQPSVLIVAQPTWGVDVGAAARIRAELMQRRDAGCAILLVSEDLDELFELADRIAVLARGHLSPPQAARDLTLAQVGRWMAGEFIADAQDAHAAAA